MGYDGVHVEHIRGCDEIRGRSVRRGRTVAEVSITLVIVAIGGIRF